MEPRGRAGQPACPPLSARDRSTWSDQRAEARTPGAGRSQALLGDGGRSRADSANQWPDNKQLDTPGCREGGGTAQLTQGARAIDQICYGMIAQLGVVRSARPPPRSSADYHPEERAWYSYSQTRSIAETEDDLDL